MGLDAFDSSGLDAFIASGLGARASAGTPPFKLIAQNPNTQWWRRIDPDTMTENLDLRVTPEDNATNDRGAGDFAPGSGAYIYRETAAQAIDFQDYEGAGWTRVLNDISVGINRVGPYVVWGVQHDPGQDNAFQRVNAEDNTSFTTNDDDDWYPRDTCGAYPIYSNFYAIVQEFTADPDTFTDSYLWKMDPVSLSPTATLKIADVDDANFPGSLCIDETGDVIYVAFYVDGGSDDIRYLQAYDRNLGRLSALDFVIERNVRFFGKAIQVIGDHCFLYPLSSSQVIKLDRNGSEIASITVGAGNQSTTLTVQREELTVAITTITPAEGDFGGGLTVVIVGKGFADGMTVKFRRIVSGTSELRACTSVAVLSSTQLTCVTPAWISGILVSVVVEVDGLQASIWGGTDAIDGFQRHGYFYITGTRPVVTIDLPASGASFGSGESIAFEGTAIDVEDGDISANMNWTSSIDGFFQFFSASFSAVLSDGTHIITAQVTDSDFNLGTSISISITVG